MKYVDGNYEVESYPDGRISYPTTKGQQRDIPEYISDLIPYFANVVSYNCCH